MSRHTKEEVIQSGSSNLEFYAEFKNLREKKKVYHRNAIRGSNPKPLDFYFRWISYDSLRGRALANLHHPINPFEV